MEPLANILAVAAEKHCDHDQDNLQAEVARVIEHLDAPQRVEMRDLLTSLLETQRARIEYAESRRGALATVGGVVLAAGLAGLLAVGNSSGWTYFPAWLGLLCTTASLVLSGVLILTIYGRQTNWNYPFKQASRTWKHFYRDAIPGASEPPAPWYLYQSKAFKSASEAHFSQLYHTFAIRTLSLRDPTINLAQDLQQSYLLHWNEMYKNRFLTSLRKVVVMSVTASVALGVVGLCIGMISAPNRFKDHAPQTLVSVSTRQK